MCVGALLDARASAISGPWPHSRMGRRARRAAVAIATLTCVMGARRADAQPPPASAGEQPVDPYAPQAPQPAPQAEPGLQPENQPGQDLGPDTSAADDDIDEQVAQALYRRGLQLYRRGDAADAK